MNKIWIKPGDFDKWCLKRYCLGQCGKFHSRIICKYGNNCVNPYCTYVHNSHKYCEFKLKNINNDKSLSSTSIKNKPIVFKNKTLSLCKFGCKCKNLTTGKCKFIHNSTNSINSDRYFNKIIHEQSVKINNNISIEFIDGGFPFYIDKKGNL